RHAGARHYLHRHAHGAGFLYRGDVLSAPAAAGAGSFRARCEHVHRPAADPQHARELKNELGGSTAAADSAPLALPALAVDLAAARGRPAGLLAGTMNEGALLSIVAAGAPQ